MSRLNKLIGHSIVFTIMLQAQFVSAVNKQPICKPGEYLSFGTCRKCWYGYNDKIGAEKCQRCPKGSYPNKERTSCIRCPPGTYKMINRCRPCFSGYYNDLEGQEKCKKCPYGSSPNKEKTQCEVCPIGTAPAFGECRKCMYGYYNDEEGAKKCKKCPESYESIEDRTSCKPKEKKDEKPSPANSSSPGQIPPPSAKKDSVQPFQTNTKRDNLSANQTLHKDLLLKASSSSFDFFALGFFAFLLFSFLGISYAVTKNRNKKS